jgi:GNAT superfamily N-acetyltransferase
MTIRPAVLEDVPALVEMGMQFLRSSGYGYLYAENEPQMEALARHLIEGPSSDFLVVECGSGLVGMIGLTAQPHFISGRLIAGEVVYWVEEGARGAGVRLLKAAEQWARDHGAEWMQMVSPTPRVDAFYTRLGYVPVERTFQKAL